MSCGGEEQRLHLPSVLETVNKIRPRESGREHACPRSTSIRPPLRRPSNSSARSQTSDRGARNCSATAPTSISRCTNEDPKKLTSRKPLLDFQQQVTQHRRNHNASFTHT